MMKNKTKLAIGIVAALALSGGGVTFAQSINNVNSNQVIYACVTGVNGNIIRVSNTPKSCPRGTTPISWNMVGPQGIQGIPGTAAAKGDKGDQGPQGLKGEKGLDGKDGAPGVSSSSTTYRVFESTGLRKPVVLGTMIEFAGQAWNIDGLGKLRANMTTPLLFAESGCQGDRFGVLEPNFGAGLAVESEETSGQLYWSTHFTHQDWQEFKSIYIAKPQWRLVNELGRLFLHFERDWEKNAEDYAPDPLYNVGSGGRCVDIDMRKVQQLFLSHYPSSEQMHIKSQISASIKKLMPISTPPELGPWYYEFPEN